MPAIYWSTTKIKFTLGIGSLGFAGIFSETFGKSIPVWYVIVPIMIPLLVFVFSDDFPPKWTLRLQQAGSILYLAIAILGIAMAINRNINFGHLALYCAMMIIGAIPCAIVLLGPPDRNEDPPP